MGGVGKDRSCLPSQPKAAFLSFLFFTSNTRKAFSLPPFSLPALFTFPLQPLHTTLSVSLTHQAGTHHSLLPLHPHTPLASQPLTKPLLPSTQPSYTPTTTHKDITQACCRAQGLPGRVQSQLVESKNDAIKKVCVLVRFRL